MGRGLAERKPDPIALTATQREIERLHREGGLAETAIAKELGVPRRIVEMTLDLPISAFRVARSIAVTTQPIAGGSEARALRAEDTKRRNARAFEDAPWRVKSASDLTFRPFASDAIKGALRFS